MFGYLAGVTLSEYIRRRRITCAAVDLQKGCKVIDVALRYGYGSPTAFTRAFKAVHGISPASARQDGGRLKSFPPVSFKLTVKGVEEMNYRIKSKPEFRIVGVREEISNDAKEGFDAVPLLWQKAVPSLSQIASIMDGELKGLLGVSTCNEAENEQNYYYIAAESSKDVPEGMYELLISAGTWAIFSGCGQSDDIQCLQQRIVSEWLPTSGYEWANVPDIEVYLNDDPANRGV